MVTVFWISRRRLQMPKVPRFLDNDFTLLLGHWIFMEASVSHTTLFAAALLMVLISRALRAKDLATSLLAFALKLCFGPSLEISAVQGEAPDF